MMSSSSDIFEWNINNSRENSPSDQLREEQEVIETSEFDEESPEFEPSTLEEPILVSAAPIKSGHNAIRDNATLVSQMYYVPTIPIWPKSSETGVGYVVFTESLPQEIKEKPWKMFQYSLKRSQPPERTSSHFLESALCAYHKYECTGVKICEHLDPRLRDWHHTEVSNAYWNLWEQQQRELSQGSNERDGAAWAWAIMTDYRQHRSCARSLSGHIDTCRPFFYRDETRHISGQYVAKVRCQHWQYNNGHHHTTVPSRFSQVLFLIENIISGLENAASPPRETCCTVDRTTRQKLGCDITHIPSGAGKIVRVECKVIWKVYIPYDPTIPYLLITSHGIHNHPPPPPTKVPIDVLVKLRETITQRERTPDSLNLWAQSSGVESLCRSYDSRNLAQVHPSLANISRLRYLFRSQQAIHFPLGVSRLGAYHEYLTHHKNNNQRYIQIFEDNGTDLLIVTFYREQVKLLADPNFLSFQVDMNYKHIASKTDHEIIWGTYNREAKMTFPILRAIMNSQTAEAYQNLYSKVFNFIAHEFSIRPKWYHLHHEGIRGVTLDQDQANMKGLGEYLSQEVDHTHQPWQIQATLCIRLCHIHFERGIEQTCNKLGDFSRGLGSMYRLMLSLKDAESKEAFFEICNLLTQTYPALTHWVQHKQELPIAAGLCFAYSQMTYLQWNSCERSTNHVEQLHEASYQASGRYSSLLKVIKANEAFDLNKITRQNTSATLGVQLSYDDLTVAGRFRRDNQRKRSRSNSSSSSIPPGDQRQGRVPSRRREVSIHPYSRPSIPSSPLNPRSQRDLSVSSARSVSSSGVPRSPRVTPAQTPASIPVASNQPSQIETLEYQRIQLQIIQHQIQLKELELEKIRLEKGEKN